MKGQSSLPVEKFGSSKNFDLIYRPYVPFLFNYVSPVRPSRRSISSGRIRHETFFQHPWTTMFSIRRRDANIISYRAGHKALGLYSLWACETKLFASGLRPLLPSMNATRVRLEDLLGFRRNPITKDTLFKKLNVKALETAHPTPATPFVRLSPEPPGWAMPVPSLAPRRHGLLRPVIHPGSHC